MSKFPGYKCSQCGQEFKPDEVTYLCPNDGGVLDVLLDIDVIKRTTGPRDIQASSDFSIWRYLPLLPVGDPGHTGTPLRSAGWTPVYSPPALARSLNMGQLWIKDESSNPTASFKDRASALLIARAQEIGAKVIVTASTGNAGAALAGMAAAASARAVIFAPKTAPPAKVAQLLIFGASVFLVDGSYGDAVELSRQAADEFGWYCRNTGYNPFTAEGKKTAALEIWEQVIATQKLDIPLSVFVSVGDGNIISGIHKGFKDLLALGWIEKVPRIFGVQAEGSAAIANAFEAGKEKIEAVQAKTIADSISVDLPSDGLRALRAATHTGGAYIKVSDESILKAIADLGRSGIFAEPAGAAAFAGLRKALESGLIASGDPVLVINTGSGLKDVSAARKAAGEAPVIEPTLAALKRVLEVQH
ncbi:MAG: threonine synthase [Chloroflexi bacterium]|nr:threonine synthase [Chloroflexota bacterium]